MIKNIIPTEENIKYWITTLLPSKDVWFFKEKPNFFNIEIIDIYKYLSEYDNLEYINSYCHWLVRKNAKYVIVDENNWILSLSECARNYVYKQQIELERGLIIEDCSFLINCKEIDKALFDNKIILSNAVFNCLDIEIKKQLAISYAKEQDEWSYYDINLKNSSLEKIKNTFINHEGTNCLAIVLYAVTLNEKYLSSWVNQEEFLYFINDYNEINNNNIQYGDILIFYDDNSLIQHSCFALSRDLILNKSGQSKFNPIVVQNYDNIVNDWQDLKLVIKRKVRK